MSEGNKKINLNPTSQMSGGRQPQNGWNGNLITKEFTSRTSTMEKKKRLGKDNCLLMAGVDRQILYINFTAVIGMVINAKKSKE